MRRGSETMPLAPWPAIVSVKKLGFHCPLVDSLEDPRTDHRTSAFLGVFLGNDGWDFRRGDSHARTAIRNFCHTEPMDNGLHAGGSASIYDFCVYLIPHHIRSSRTDGERDSPDGSLSPTQRHSGDGGWPGLFQTNSQAMVSKGSMGSIDGCRPEINLLTSFWRFHGSFARSHF